MTQEVWALDVPDRLVAAQQPVLSFKSIGWRAMGQQQPIRIRADSVINVPQPCVTLIVNQRQEVIGYTLGIDVTARDLGDVPQAKIYDGACALGPGLQLLDGDTLPELSLTLEVMREARSIWRGDVALRLEPLPVADWIAWLYREMSFPHGAFLMLSVPFAFPADFTLHHGDSVTITDWYVDVRKYRRLTHDSILRSRSATGGTPRHNLRQSRRSSKPRSRRAWNWSPCAAVRARARRAAFDWRRASSHPLRRMKNLN